MDIIVNKGIRLTPEHTTIDLDNEALILLRELIRRSQNGFPALAPNQRVFRSTLLEKIDQLSVKD